MILRKKTKGRLSKLKPLLDFMRLVMACAAALELLPCDR